MEISNKKTKQTIVFIVGAMMAGLISILNAPVLTRTLTTTTYVEYSMFISLVSVLSAVICMGYDSCYMRFYHKNTGIKFLLICLSIPTIICFLSCVLIFATRNNILEIILGEKISILECFFFCFYLISKTTARFTLLTMRMEGFAWNYVISDCVERLFFITFIILFRIVFGDVPFSYVLVAFGLGFAIEVAINIFRFPKTNRSFYYDNKIENAGGELFKFGVFLGVSNIIMFCIPLVQKIIIRQLLDVNQAAIFFSASIFATAISLISVSVNNVWEPNVYKTINEGGSIKSAFHKYGIFISWFLLSILGAVLVFRRYLVYVLAEQYRNVYIIAPCITFTACFSIIYYFYSVGLEISKKTWVRFIITPLELALSIIFLYFFAEIESIKTVAIALLIGGVVSRIIGIVIGLMMYDTGRTLIKPIICWILSLIIAIISLYFDDSISDVIIGLFALIAAYLVTFKDINEIIKTFIKTIKEKKEINSHD